MTDEQLVVDASVVVTLLIGPGSLGETVAKRLDSARAHAPAHLPVELTNALRRLRNKGRLSESEALLALRGFWSLPIELWPQESISERTWELGQNLTAYDAAYVAVAEKIGGALLTADARLSRAPGIKCAIEVFS
jgi:predicted nucleic acid-binding protein